LSNTRSVEFSANAISPGGPDYWSSKPAAVNDLLAHYDTRKREPLLRQVNAADKKQKSLIYQRHEDLTRP